MQTSKKPMIFIIALLMGILPYGVVYSYERLDGQTTDESKPPKAIKTPSQPAKPAKKPKVQPREVSCETHTDGNAYAVSGKDFGIQMISIPSGEFRMGSSRGDNEADDDEKPAHCVRVNSFQMSATEVTQGQWQAVMGNNPSYFKDCGANCPVEQVSWDDIQDYIRKLNAKTGHTYRLPSEAEWEYAAKAGGSYTYAGSNDVGSVAWYGGNSGSKTHPVAQKSSNAWGLYDMSGNVWEWVQDRWHSNYTVAPSDGSAWENGGSIIRVLRGGSWGNLASYSRSAYRLYYSPGNRLLNLGFRLARTR